MIPNEQEMYKKSSVDQTKKKHETEFKDRLGVEVDKIPKERIYALARPVLDAVKKAFEDPETVKDYEIWLVEYRKRQQKKLEQKEGAI